MARAILGQTLTSSEGSRSGSLALGEIHNEIRRDYMRADAWLLMDIVNEQLVRPLVELNFGPEVPAPRWTIDTAAELDLADEVGVDRQLLQMGVPLPQRYFYEKYGRPAPIGGDARLNTTTRTSTSTPAVRNSDGNEVRVKLGWPRSPGATAQPRRWTPRSNPSTPGGATGEDTRATDNESENEAEKMKGQK